MAILRIIFLLSAFVVQGLAESGKSPNIVFIFGDDLGWGDVSFHNSKQIPTPNIDAIARDGIILNQYYVQPICSPSRGALMTGKYPIRIGFQHSVIRGPQPWGLPVKEKILPEYLKELDYATHSVGKWHLGFYKSEYLPQNRGFDSNFGYWNGEEDYFTHVARDMGLSGLDLHDNCENVWRFNGTYGTDLYTSMAKKIIRNHSKNNKNQPLFLYLAQQAAHGGNRDTYPLQAPEKYTRPLVGINPEGRHTFAGMVSALDFSVGEVFAALETHNMLDDTIFIFSTDNGGAVEGLAGTYGSNYPLRGSKQTLWEGGVRGVGFIWSSRLRQRSRIYNELMHVTDWLPTLLSAVGGSKALELLKDDTIDGVDHWPSLTQDCPSSRQEDLLNIDNIQNRGPEALELLEVGTIDEVDWKPLSQDCPSPRQEVLLNIDNIQNTTAIRQNNFKLISGTFQNGKFDGHFNQTGMPMGYYPSSFTPQQEILYQQTYNRYLKRAKAAKVLKEKYRRDPMLAASCLTPICKLQLEINCGVRLPVSPCNVAEAPCLFDLSTDPCELNNLAEILPEVVQQLQDSMNKYIPYIVPFGEKPFDPKADPALHGDAWVPWQSSCCEPRGVCMSDEMKLI